ncbi:MAG: methyltransferase domain-containing protein [Candidatus Adiutrix sp.]|jgi:SAM-dependent methyltransferase|nr:methyltransferase domain-containing protein [Candidatus Adiutrix sp.]
MLLPVKTRLRWLREAWFPRPAEPGIKIRLLDIGRYDQDQERLALLTGEDLDYSRLQPAQVDQPEIPALNPHRWPEIDDESLDLVVGATALEHVKYPWLTFAEMARVLKPGGRICLIEPGLSEITPEGKNISFNKHAYLPDYYRFSPAALAGLAEYAGLRPLHASLNQAPAGADPAAWFSPRGLVLLAAEKPAAAADRPAPELEEKPEPDSPYLKSLRQGFQYCPPPSFSSKLELLGFSLPASEVRLYLAHVFMRQDKLLQATGPRKARPHLPPRGSRPKIRLKSLPRTALRLDNNFTDLGRFICRDIESLVLHQKTFGEYKGAFAGRDVVLVAAGPTANDYIPIKNALHVGCNRAFMLNKVKFDFLFCLDRRGIDSFMNEFVEYTGNNCVKFICNQSAGHITGGDWLFPESLFLKLKNARKYKTNGQFVCRSEGDFILGWPIPVDIDIQPLWNSFTIAHQALQFILFTNPRRIYLVGCDCTVTSNEHFISGDEDSRFFESLSLDVNRAYYLKMMMPNWEIMKNFAANYYPDTEIISINPVRLKGMFSDVYTKPGDEDNISH